MTGPTRQGNEAPVVAGHLYGLRVWQLSSRGGRFRLRSASARFDWNPEEPGAARCRKADHPAPATDCSCGYYCFHQSQDSMMKVLLATRRPFSGASIAGVVRTWGRTEVHPTGMRSEFATPEAFFIPDDASPAFRGVVTEMSELYDAAIWDGDPSVLLQRMKATKPGLSSSYVRGLVGDASSPNRTKRRRDQELFRIEPAMARVNGFKNLRPSGFWLAPEPMIPNLPHRNPRNGIRTVPLVNVMRRDRWRRSQTAAGPGTEVTLAHPNRPDFHEGTIDVLTADGTMIGSIPSAIGKELLSHDFQLEKTKAQVLCNWLPTAGPTTTWPEEITLLVTQPDAAKKLNFPGPHSEE